MNNLAEIDKNIVGIKIKQCITQKMKSYTNIHYYEYLCDTYKVIRFSSKILEDIFGLNYQENSLWTNKYKALYEVRYDGQVLNFSCLVDYDSLTSKQKLRFDKFKTNNSFPTNRIFDLQLTCEKDKMQVVLNSLLNKEFEHFEFELEKWKDNENYIIKSDLDSDDKKYFTKDELDDDFYIEGEMIPVVSNKYERNKEARKACLEHYGYKCQICGFDFKEFYGEDFEGKIEVHHIVPISEIGRNYVVDPIKDLIPVCPNCHRALHSKKDGVYTPNELREKIKIAKNK